jgi:hypothetical protein
MKHYLEIMYKRGEYLYIISDETTCYGEPMEVMFHIFEPALVNRDKWCNEGGPLSSLDKTKMYAQGFGYKECEYLLEPRLDTKREWLNISVIE